MKKIGIVLTMLFVGLAMYAQEPQVLVLKDGTVVKGNVEKLPDGGARVTNEFGDIFEYSADEVSYAGKELSERQMKKQQKAASARDYAAPMKGYKLFLEPGIGVGSFPYNTSYYPYPMVMFNVINGYSFSQYLYVGGGIGLNTCIQELYIPIYAHIRSSFIKKRTSPFVSASFGYAFAVDVDYNSAGFADIGLGICVKRKRKGEVWISLNGEACGSWTGALLKVGYSF